MIAVECIQLGGDLILWPGTRIVVRLGSFWRSLGDRRWCCSAWPMRARLRCSEPVAFKAVRASVSDAGLLASC
jgi:hypothetical protein